MFDIEQFIEDNSIVLRASYVDYNPYIPHESQDMKHCFCRLSGQTMIEFEFYLSYVDTEEGYTPDAAFVIERLLDDVRSFRDCNGYSDFAALLGIEEDDADGILAFEEAGRLSDLIGQHFTFDEEVASVPALQL